MQPSFGTSIRRRAKGTLHIALLVSAAAQGIAAGSYPTPERLRDAVQDALKRNDPDELAGAIEPDPADAKAARTEAQFIVRAYAPDGIVSLRTLAEFDAAMAGEGPIHQRMPDAAAGFLCDWVAPPVGDLYVEKTPGNGTHELYAKVKDGYLIATVTRKSLHWQGPPDRLLSYSFEFPMKPVRTRKLILHVVWTASGVTQSGNWTIRRTFGGQVLVNSIDALDIVDDSDAVGQPFKVLLDGAVAYETQSLPPGAFPLYRREAPKGK